MGSITGHDDGGALRPLRADELHEIAGYRLLARIGEGGMGSVYLSRTRGNQPVALKVIRREYAGDAEFRRRFQQEVRAAKQVRGYHLVPVVDHDAEGEQPWLATAYVPGLPLDEVLAVHGPLPLPAALQLTGCVARALDAVHAAAVVHRDLKPGNILLGADGPWVIDFGIARAAEATRLTRTGGFVGTPQFMSPEQGTGAEPTTASDVFSLGLIAAVAATGRHPYGDGAALTVATQIANTAQRPPDLSGYPEGLRPVLERCLAADPAARPTAAEVAELCEKASGRAPRAFDGWLPAPVATAIAARAEHVRQLVAGAPQAAQPAAAAATPAHPATYVPTQAPGGSVHAAPTQAATAPPAAPLAPAGATPPWRRRAPLAAGVAVALTVVAGAAWALSGGDGGSGAKAADASASATPAHSDSKQASQGTGGPSGGASKAPARTYEAVFTDRPLAIAPPGTGTLITVDLDAPKVSPQGDVSDHDAELTYMSQWMHFKTATAKSSGSTPEECRRAVDAAPLPAELGDAALIDQGVLAKDDVLCTVTSKGNLAMLKITEVTPTGQPYSPPGYSGLLTVWKQPS
ncbi:serine/threonine-protein kinase [Streptomyces sp. NPDC049585]|uniref:serine/threonine-protein kinase n=1 Tax=Streptomyces sp. NPDC049585 TaxID=3155154 RepID=UPI00342BA225